MRGLYRLNPREIPVRQIFLTLALILVARTLSAAPLGGVSAKDLPLPPPEAQYPVWNEAASVRESYKDPAGSDGRAVAVEGKVASVLFNERGQPSIELILGGEGEDTNLWATWALPNSNYPFLVPGQTLRMFGFLRETTEWSKVTRAQLPRQNVLTLLPLCMAIIPGPGAVYDGKYADYCEAWRRGYRVPNMAHAK